MRGLTQVAGVSLLTILMECIKGRWSLVLASPCLPFPGREAAWELTFEDGSFSGGQQEGKVRQEDLNIHRVWGLGNGYL